MKIAITGASGFIGKELLAVLNNNKGVKINSLTRGSIDNKASSVCSWITTDYSVNSLIDGIKGCDIVIHLAGVRGTTNNLEDFAVNIDMTDNILRAMIAVGTKRIVFASSISVYDDEKLIPWKENSPLRGRTAYGDSKIQCEKLIQEYAEKNDLTYAIARVAQVIGEGEKRRGMMNAFIDTARIQGTIKVMGKSEAKRQYIYVKDLAEVLTVLAIGNNLYNTNSNMVLNVGMKKAYSNIEIARIVNEVFNNNTPIDYDDSYDETIKSAYMDTYRLTNSLGYNTLDMHESIKACL